jgi:hypothetical protein
LVYVGVVTAGFWADIPESHPVPLGASIVTTTSSSAAMVFMVFHADMMGDAPIERLVLPIWSAQAEPLA